MAMSATFTTVNGMLMHESRGGVETYYIPDPVGSCIQTKDATGNVTSTTEYWPYGEVQTSTGTNPSSWGFVGLLGYLVDVATRLYVRARYYRPGQCQWQTEDPLWPGEQAYEYARGNPGMIADPSGLSDWDSGACKKAYDIALEELKKCFDPKDAKVLAAVMMCIAYGESSCSPTCTSKGANETACGLYQLGSKEMKRCHPAGCCDNDIQTQIRCNTKSAIGLVLWQVSTFGGGTIENSFCHYWGVFDCGKRGKENKNTAACLHAKGIDPHALPMPKPLPGCDPCH